MNGNLRGTLHATYTQRIRNGNVITKAEWAYENYRWVIQWPDWYQLPCAVRRHAAGNRLCRRVSEEPIIARCGKSIIVRSEASRCGESIIVRSEAWRRRVSEESIIAPVIKASRAAGRSIIAHSVIKASCRRATGESIIERWPLARWGPGQSYRAGPKWFTGKTYRQAAKCATGKRAEVSGFFQNCHLNNYFCALWVPIDKCVPQVGERPLLLLTI